jgi:hypothetical protein
MHTNPHEPQHRESFVSLAETKNDTSEGEGRQDTAAPPDSTGAADAGAESATAPDQPAKPVDLDHDHGAEIRQPAAASEEDEGLMAKIVEDGRLSGF